MSETPESILRAAQETAYEALRTFARSQAYDRVGEVASVFARALMAEREACAYQARNGCLVPPDGGSPTEAEAELCEEIARRIRDR